MTSARRIDRPGGIKLLIALAAFGAYGAIGWSLLRFEGLPRRLTNGAEYAVGEGIRFRSPGLARSLGAPAWQAEAIRSGVLEVDLEARALLESQSGPARILTLSRNTSLRNLTLGQEGTALVLRLRTPKSSLNGEPAYVIQGVFRDGGWRRIGLRIEGGSLVLSIDGKMVLSEALPPRALSTWDPRALVLLGNEVGGQRPWLGEIRSATVRTQGAEIEVATPGYLEIPAHYWALGGAGAKGAHGASRRAIRDMVVNLLGFAPLGLLLALLWPRLSLLRAACLCGGVSLIIEAGQLLVPGHFPSVVDIALNTLGGTLGCWLSRLLLSRRRGPLDTSLGSP